jgi:hypothetical protein
VSWLAAFVWALGLCSVLALSFWLDDLFEGRHFWLVLLLGFIASILIGQLAVRPLL